jgi:lysophospholipid acyltransferase (LPLAT)-like uncharacterized protein
MLNFTIRFKVVNAEKVRELHEKNVNIIMSFWHGRLLMMDFAYMGKKGSILVSMHEDGEMIARAMKFSNYGSVRGSTTRGGAKALREMVKVMKAGSDILITPDGPKGPSQVVQNGVVILAKMSGAPICPVTYSVSKLKQFSSWDGFILPYPFSRGVVIWGEPVYVDKDADKDELEQKRVELEEEMNRIIKEADSYF